MLGVELLEHRHDRLIEVRATAVVLLQRQDHRAEDERDEWTAIHLSFAEQLRAFAMRVLVELAPRVAEEQPDDGKDREEDRDRKQGLRRFDEALNAGELFAPLPEIR